MGCLGETARTAYTYFFPSRMPRGDRAAACRLANRDLDSVLARFPAAEMDDGAAEPGPIFLFSAGWRSGSTLLQRLVCSDSSVLVWGEPYDYCHLTEHLIQSLRPFSNEWPKESFFIGEKDNSTALSNQWIANLYPSTHRLRDAHRQLFLSLYKKSCLEKGFTRWGIKEIRYGGNEIRYLRWLFPNSRFVLLLRNPYDCWRSYRGKNWFLRWPDLPVRDPKPFARHWTSLASDFLEQRNSDDAYVVRYEDLGDTDTLAELSDHLNVEIKPEVLEKRIRGKVKRSQKSCLLVEKMEKLIIKNETKPFAHKLGYFD